ncbi:MAG: permease-like cell division protein FtsX [Patescibacteria group bacterium]
MITTLSRIIHFGFKNFWRNGLLSTATVAVMFLALLVSLGLIIFREVTSRAVVSLQDKIDIVVYFNTNTPEDQILNIKQSVESLAEVKGIDYVSRVQALELFKSRHKTEQSITRAINIVGDNPLEASLNIKAYSPDQYASIATSLNNPVFKDFISQVSYEKNKVAIDRLVAIIEDINRGGLALTILLAVVAGLIVFNTIRLAIYSNRDEIGIMRAVGASNALVRGPFMVDGMVVGILAAVFSLILAIPIISFLSPYLSRFIPGLNISQYFYSNLITFLLLQMVFGMAIGTVSSFLAVRKYLKN